MSNPDIRILKVKYMSRVYISCNTKKCILHVTENLLMTEEISFHSVRSILENEKDQIKLISNLK